MKNRVIGFDFIRTFAIITVFIGHIVNAQSQNGTLSLLVRILSPGLTMSLLGFISGYLITNKNGLNYDGTFYVKRFVRIYIPLFLCLFFVSTLHLTMGKDIISQQLIFHFMGLSGFFDLFQLKNNSSIGLGLWFVTVIILMYLLLPFFSKLLSHKYGMIHLVLFILFFLLLNLMLSGVSSICNVIISYVIGVYVGVNRKIDLLLYRNTWIYACGTGLIFLICAFSIQKIIPYHLKNFLFPLYPVVVFPLLFKIGCNFPPIGCFLISAFASISYEVYILHFYFINNNLIELFPHIQGISMQTVVAFGITLPLAYILSKVASRLNRAILTYLL